MSRAATGTVVFGVYLIILGAGQMVMPNVVLPLVGFAETQEVWVRVLGLLLMILGYHCIIAGLTEDLSFFQAALVTQPFSIVVLVAFIALGQAGANMFLLALANAVFLAWIWWALRNQPGSN